LRYGCACDLVPADDVVCMAVAWLLATGARHGV
jgi:hypothetical protein